MHGDHFKVAEHHFQVASDFPHFSEKDPEAGAVGGRRLLKDLPQIIRLKLGFALTSA